MAGTARTLAGVPHLTSLMAWSQAGRLYQAGTGVTITFLVAGWTSSYVLAGLVGAALTLGQAIAGPVRGRATDRGPAGRALIGTSACYGIGLLAIALLPHWLPPAAWPAMAGLALLTGAFLPPVTQASRMIWPRVGAAERLDALYGLDASLQELTFVVSPVLATAAVAVWGPSVALVGVAVLAVLGSCGFAAALRRAGLDVPLPAQATKQRGGGSLPRRPEVLSCLAIEVLLVIALYSTDLAILAWARNQGLPLLAGVLAAVWAIGSLLGGLYTGRSTRPARLPLRLALSALGLAVLAVVLPPVLSAPSPVLVAGVLLLGGTAVAPSLAAIASRLAGRVPEDRRGEAFGWLATAVTLGSTVALPLSGAVLSHGGPGVSVALATVVAVLAAGLSVGWRPGRTGPRRGSRDGATGRRRRSRS